MPKQVKPRLQPLKVPVFQNFVSFQKKDWDKIRMAFSNCLYLPAKDGVIVKYTKKEWEYLYRKLYFGHNL